MRVAIIGCGTGGPAAALLLHRQGHQVQIFERVAHPGPVGAGIMLQPTGMEVLRRLGLLQRVLPLGSRVERLYGRSSYGRVVLDLGYADLQPGLFGLGIHRGALFDVLLDAVREAGIPLHTGVEIEGLDERADGVIVQGERFDRVIVASGARSGLAPPGARVRPYPWGALWCVLRADPTPGVLTQRFRDTREMVGMMPSGAGLTSLFWSVRGDRLDGLRAEGLDAWKRRVGALMPEAPLDAIHSLDELVFAPYFDRVAPRWNTKRVVWIGDAAHAMSPQLGQGANLALCDALALSEAPDLDAYSRARRDHLRFYSLASRLLTPFFQSSWPVLAPLRDLVGMPLHRWPWYRRQMLLALAGVKTGPLSAAPLPDIQPS